MNWARIIMIAIVALFCAVGWAYWQYRKLIREFDAERARAYQWNEDRL